MMRFDKFALAILVCAILFVSMRVSAQSEKLFNPTDTDLEKGRKIMMAADALGMDPEAMVAETTMMIVKGDPGNAIIKRSKTHRKKYSDILTKSLSETVYPSRMKILTHSYSNRSDDIWIKLSSGSSKRISAAGKQGYIQNSHFTYEDMESRDLDDYRFRLLGEVTIKVAGVATPCYQVESIKMRGEESRYSRTHIYRRIEDLFTVRTDMWDQNGNPHKTLRVLASNKLRGHAEYTIAAKLGVSLVDDPRTKRIDEGRDQYTIMEMTEIKVDDAAQIDDSLFRKESL